mmetsp:Transcript_24229/g.28511  ORF Transcript_24229/g.28511 Transcript_24229/m.28511 type:complete len:103 (+) Transcript_24229:187-495(+)
MLGSKFRRDTCSTRPSSGVLHISATLWFRNTVISFGDDATAGGDVEVLFVMGVGCGCTTPASNQSLGNSLQHRPGLVRPALPARCLQESLAHHTVSRDLMPE